MEKVVKKFGKEIYSLEEFKNMVKEFKRELNKLFEGDEIIGFKPNHYITSGFVRRGNKYVYISIPDVRHNTKWFDNILIRKAENDKDYIGKSNHFVKIIDIKEGVEKLLR